MTSRNGLHPLRAFPRSAPLLLAPVKLPFRGSFEDVTILYNVTAVRALMDDNAAGLHALAAPLAAQEAALAREDSAAFTAAQDALLVEQAFLTIAACVHAVEWPYADPPPSPQDRATWGGWDPLILLWIAHEGLYAVGAEWIGPFARAVMPRRS